MNAALVFLVSLFVLGVGFEGRTRSDEVLGMDRWIEREVLHDYGNMSAPTVMFVLERLLERGLPDKVMMTAFGPGFTCAAMLLEAA